MAGDTTRKNDWAKRKLDRISLTVPKGQRAELQAHAKQHEESLNGFINRAINEALERDAVFDRLKETMEDLAEKNHVNIDEQELQELRELAVAFAALKPHIPDIEKIYFSQRQQERQRKPFQMPPIKELGTKKDQDA